MPTETRATPVERGLRDLTWRDWRAVLGRALLDMNDDAAPLLSAGVAFYMFLSVFPALLAALTVYGLLADPTQVERQLADVLQALPGDARSLLADRLHALTLSTRSEPTPKLVGAVLGALWTSSLGVTGLLKAVKIAYDEPEDRNFLQLRWTGILLTVGGLVFLATALGLLTLLPVVLNSTGLGGSTRLALAVLRWVAVGVLALVTLTLIYHLGADRSGADPKWTGPGTVVATVLWVGLNAGFSWYAARLAHYSTTYGSIAGGVVLLLWLFLTTLVVLFGAEVNAEAERQARGQVRPRHKEAPWTTALRFYRRHRPGSR